MERRFENQYGDLDRDTADLVKKVAHRIARRRNGFGEDDRPDIEQELVIAVRRGLPQHDTERGERAALLSRIIRNRARQLVRDRKAACRDFRLESGSFQDPVRRSDGKSAKKGERFDASEYLRTTGDASQAGQRTEMKLDIARVVAALPPELAETVALLAEELNDVEIATHLGIARSTLYLRLARLREAMRAAGLADYFG